MKNVLTEQEYLANEKARMTPITKSLLYVLQHAKCLPREMFLAEHQALVAAWEPLSWFYNLDGGPVLYAEYCEYLKALKNGGYKGDLLEEAYKEHGI